jgi:hypothetical protein
VLLLTPCDVFIGCEKEFLNFGVEMIGGKG